MSVRRRAGEAWSFRARVESEAALRFDRLAAEIAALDASSPVPASMRRAADDERRHEKLCAGLAAAYGEPVREVSDARIAPARLAPREAALYEVVAACCITETESMATLATLLADLVTLATRGEDAEARVREVLHEIAHDEVVHARMGWTHLAREAAAGDVSFLSSWIPVMLEGTVDGALFAPADAELESPQLLRHGVLPHSRKREIFVGALEEVVFPGLEKFNIATAPAREWLSRQAACGGRG